MSGVQLQPHTVRLSELVNELLKQGFHPRDIRRQFAARGIRWEYKFSTAVDGLRKQHQGNREKARRLRQIGLKKCANCSNTLSIGLPEDLCYDCLAEKWGPNPQNAGRGSL